MIWPFIVIQGHGLVHKWKADDFLLVFHCGPSCLVSLVWVPCFYIHCECSLFPRLLYKPSVALQSHQLPVLVFRTRRHVGLLLYLHCVSKKVPTFKLFVTLPNLNRFSIFGTAGKRMKFAKSTNPCNITYLTLGRFLATLPWEINCRTGNNGRVACAVSEVYWSQYQ